jgi:hypothetical protein
MCSIRGKFSRFPQPMPCQHGGMAAGKTIFPQVMDWVHPEQFRRCVQGYAGNSSVRSFPCWEQFLAVSFAEINYRESLADMETCLCSRPDQLDAMGFRSTVAHSTLAEARAFSIIL